MFPFDAFDLPVVGPLIASSGDSVWRGLRVVANTDPLTPLANYGALGVMVAAFMLGLVYGRPTMERALAEIDRANERTDAALNGFARIEAELAQLRADMKVRDDAAAADRLALREVVGRNITLLEYYERGTGRT